ncbi:serine hydrolase domain-containing protein [Microlunatus parietis]|uniref:CubicO group peptidase (Beta-lactamase class C family) n=1 Tax=Microlunatus parietis TaxID=682979 RepID=A0A7Y9LE85_9ACTN|nr:serine hydrolase domain-containing protein [Microlunatus parietis]NYE73620.1 CubicO group peptidase (beta-lactamase class C family) [Microlunatus parietis]
MTWDAVDAAIDNALAERRIVGTVVLIAKDGELAYRRAAGLADRETGRPMTEQTWFRWSSLSKPVTATTTLALVERGELDLTSPVTRWLPDFRPALADGTRPEITVDHLLLHTAGLRYGFGDPTGDYPAAGISDGLDRTGLTLADNVARIAGVPLLFPPGTDWEYSVGYDVLGAVIEAATGRPLPDVVAELITGPLGLSARFAVESDENLAVPYADGEPEPTRLLETNPVPFGELGLLRMSPERILDANQFPAGGAGMAGPAGDLLTFLEAIRTGGGPILTAETVAGMLPSRTAREVAPGVTGGFGRGWSVIVDPAAEGSPLSAGSITWGGVFGHSWAVDLERKITIVSLSNTALEGMWGRFPADVFAGAVSGSPK